MRIKAIAATLTLFGAALTPALSAGPASATSTTCLDERTGKDMTATVPAGAGADNIWVVNGNVVSAQAGDDRIFLDQVTDGPFPSDAVTCGDNGDDWIGSYLAQPSGSIAARGGTGADTLLGGTAGDFLNGNAGTDNLIGNDGDDRLKGEDGNDNLWGGDGNDFIDGGAGNDIIDGGPGVDTCVGGDGSAYTVNCEIVY
ncbi:MULTISPECIES: calcium-binding protein [Actinomadura]|uniref:calcium-binding protein n=1 Tax=Actinomadura TaxID=1988 RepID=UPI001BE40F4B|nr:MULTISPECIES: calcium-binding protein [Actinomadura]MBT2207919.1 hypothetical protein [Actinomadura sp. NEAU-AAG7]